MALTKEILASVAKTDDFKSVHMLKLDAMEISSCFKLLLQEFGVSLFLLTLKNNAIAEIDITLGFTNLRKLDLSTNFIANSGSKDLWATMPRLQILYLHDNLLESWDSFSSLTALPSILHLTLFNNPCIHTPDYRKTMIASLHTLLALDFHIATHEERAGIAVAHPEKSKIWIQDTTDLRNFRQHIYKLKRKWEKCSPAIKIQSMWRRFCVRKDIRGHLSEMDKLAVTIQKHVRGWLLRKKWKRDLEQLLRDNNMEHLLYTPEDFIRVQAIKKIENWYKIYKARKDLNQRRVKASTRISSCYKRWKICKTTLDLIPQLKIYVLKSQQRSLICLLRAMAKHSPDLYHPANTIHDRMAPEYFENLPKNHDGYSFAELFDRVKDCTSIKVVRFPDVDSLQYSSIPIQQMIKWVPHSKILNSGQQRPLTGVSISNKFCTENQFNILKKFKNRGSVITPKERKAVAEINWHFDDYLDLLEFEAPSKAFMTTLINLILDYNKQLKEKDLPIFIPIYDILLQRVKAACTLQACWRGCQVRRKCTLASVAIKRRAVYTIQRWWRMQKFLYRMSSLCKLKFMLRDFTSSTVFLEEHLFQHLYQTKSTFSFTEQNFEFFCQRDTVYLSQCPRNSYKLLPDWVGIQVLADKSGITPSDEEKTLQALILSGARMDVVPLHSQVFDSKIADPNMKFVKLEFRSVEEVKRRAAILYLQTLEHKNRSYIPLFTIVHLSHPFLMSRLRSVWNLRRIDHTDQCPAIQILVKALSPIDTAMTITPTPQPPQILRVRNSEKIFEIFSEPEIVERTSISSQELLRKRVQRAREENQRRQIESRVSKRIDVETRAEETREIREHNLEVIITRQEMEKREIELKKNFIYAQARKKQEGINERKFIVQFAQAKNMLQKLTKNSDLDRWKHKSRQDIKEKVLSFKEKSKERKEFIQSMLHEKYKTKGNKTAIL